MIAPAERTRLAAVLGMLGSDAVGERAAAGLLATRILKSAGTIWRELLGVDETPTPPSLQAEQRAALDLCHRFPGLLSEWERGFVAGITRRRRPLTERQAATLAKVAGELRQRCKA